MKIAATEALWNTEQPAAFSLFQIGGFSESDQTPSYSLEIPGLLSFLSTNSFHGKVVGMNQLQKQEQAKYGPGNYIPDIRLVYWSMRVMAYFGVLMLMLLVWGGWLLHKQRLDGSKWFARLGVIAIALPFGSNFAGWVLSEAGRQPWVVNGLLKTQDAVSTNVGTWLVGGSLATFVGLYAVLGIADFWLMRRYARLEPEAPSTTGERSAPIPAPGY
jgi:cytochrome d ubiquinol oxidase subunit I